MAVREARFYMAEAHGGRRVPPSQGTYTKYLSVNQVLYKYLSLYHGGCTIYLSVNQVLYKYLTVNQVLFKIFISKAGTVQNIYL